MMNYCIVSKNTLSNCWISHDNALTSGVLSTRMEGSCSGSPSNMNFLPFKKGITAPGKPIAPDLSIKIRYIKIVDCVERARTLLFYASSGEISRYMYNMGEYVLLYLLFHFVRFLYQQILPQSQLEYLYAHTNCPKIPQHP